MYDVADVLRVDSLAHLEVSEVDALEGRLDLLELALADRICARSIMLD